MCRAPRYHRALNRTRSFPRHLPSYSCPRPNGIGRSRTRFRGMGVGRELNLRPCALCLLVQGLGSSLKPKGESHVTSSLQALDLSPARPFCCKSPTVNSHHVSKKSDRSTLALWPLTAARCVPAICSPTSMAGPFWNPLPCPIPVEISKQPSNAFGKR